MNRVTLAQIEETIVSEFSFTAYEAVVNDAPITDHSAKALQLLTIVVLVLENGFTVLGKSACADPDIFDQAIGIRLARQDAVQQIWPLLGYELKQKLFLAGL